MFPIGGGSCRGAPPGPGIARTACGHASLLAVLGDPRSASPAAPRPTENFRGATERGLDFYFVWCEHCEGTMKVTKEQILALRAETGAPVIDCRKALEAAEGDPARARELLRERGLELAEKKSERVAGQGTVGTYVHNGGRVAGLVLLRCETDFVAKSDAFQSLARDLAMQVVAMNPSVVRPEEAPGGRQAEETALLSQPFIKDASGRTSVKEVIGAKVLELGENIQVERFVRFAV